MKKLPKELIAHFDYWYKYASKYNHSEKEDCYSDEITYPNLSSLNDNALVKFFFNFCDAGGGVQSQGARDKTGLRITLENDISRFRSFILEPFNENFDLTQWLNGLERYKHFGIGLATIYLNRMNKHKYSILNNKTRSAMKLLGKKLPSDNTKAYFELLDIQKEMINNYAVFKNFFKVDSFNHYIIGIDEGKKLAIELLNVHYENKSSIPEEITETEKAYYEGAHKTITINAHERNAEARNQCIKKYGYTCFVCKDDLNNKYGTLAKNYIHVHHLTQIKQSKGKYKIDPQKDLRPVCPNCHAMLHRETPPIEIDRLKGIIESTQKSGKLRIKSL